MCCCATALGASVLQADRYFFSEALTPGKGCYILVEVDIKYQHNVMDRGRKDEGGKE